MSLAARIDVMADEAFPPAHRAELDGWILRADDDPARRHRRNRSVWARATGDGDLGARIARVEDWYAGHGLPPRFQITPATSPPGLDAELAERGYAIENPSGVWTGDLGLLGAAPVQATIDERPTGAWLALSGADAAVLERVRIPCAYVRSEVAAARGALHGDWLGIYEVATLPAARRQGAATAVLAALAAWGLQRGAHHAYLLVTGSNTPANALYARLGFSRAYGYRYRVREVRTSRSGWPARGGSPRPS